MNKPAERRDNFLFGRWQRMEPFEADSDDASRTVLTNPFGSAFETLRAQPQAAVLKVKLHFSIDRKEAVRERSTFRKFGHVTREQRGVTAGGGEFRDGTGKRGVEAGKLHYPCEFRTAHPPRGFLDDQVQRSRGNFREVGRPWIQESRKRLDEAASKDAPLARKLILQVLRERGGRDDDARAGVECRQSRGHSH